jgi:hypothetical protein
VTRVRKLSVVGGVAAVAVVATATAMAASVARPPTGRYPVPKRLGIGSLTVANGGKVVKGTISLIWDYNDFKVVDARIAFDGCLFGPI